jgi:xylulokinase
MEPTHVLAIDLGTGGPKVALVTTDGDIVGHEFEPTSMLLSEGGGAEQDPEEWWTAITRAARRLLDRGLVDVADIEAVSVTAQWSGTVAVDASGNALMNAVTWMDSRGAKYIREVTGGTIKVQGYEVRKLRSFVQKSGGVPSHSGKDPTAHILFIRNERPDVYRATATFLEPADYLNLRLTGRAVSSHDCITAHWLTDNRERDQIAYDDELISLSGLDREQLPELVPSASVIGTLTDAVADEIGLAKGTKVVTGTGDVHSAVIGSGALADYAGHLYIGTSSWLTCHVPWKRTDVLNSQASIPSALPGRYFIANEHETAGECLDFLVENVLFADDLLGTERPAGVFQKLDALAATSPAGSNDVLFAPWLNGERTPVDDHTIRGGWHHLSLSSTRADMVRSVLEGVAFNSRWLLDVVEKFIKRPLPSLNFIGGGARSDLWCQIHADVLDRPINQMVDPQQANVRGAAFVASIALGHATAEELASKVKVAQTFRPDPANRVVYDELYGHFKALYKANRGLHAKMARH